MSRRQKPAIAWDAIAITSIFVLSEGGKNMKVLSKFGVML